MTVRRVTLAVVVLLESGSAMAVCSEHVNAGSIENFLGEPKNLLHNAGVGATSALANRIKGLAKYDIRTLQALIELIPSATPVQRMLIGQGMAMAYAACSLDKPEVTRRINLAIGKVSDPEVKRAFIRYLDSGGSHAPVIPSDRDASTSGRIGSSIGVGIDHGLDSRKMPLGNPFDPMEETR